MENNGQLNWVYIVNWEIRREAEIELERQQIKANN